MPGHRCGDDSLERARPTLHHQLHDGRALDLRGNRLEGGTHGDLGAPRGVALHPVVDEDEVRVVRVEGRAVAVGVLLALLEHVRCDLALVRSENVFAFGCAQREDADQRPMDVVPGQGSGSGSGSGLGQG